MEIITEISSDVEIGVTNPVRGYIKGQQVIAKHIDNDEGFISLFNELLGYNLAQYFRIRHPVFGYAYFDSHNTVVLNGKNYEHNSMFTYTHWEKNVLQITSPKMTKNIPHSEIINLILFDIYIYNTDRNNGNLLLLSKMRLFPIDYTHILPGACLWPDVIKNNDYTVEKIVEEIFSSDFYQYLIEEKTFTKEIIDKCHSDFLVKTQRLDINNIIAEIPNDLKKYISEHHIKLLKEYFSYISSNFYKVIDLLYYRIGKE